MYRVSDYLWMISDETRVDAYAAAIRSVVKPGDRVLEIGAGFGFFSVLAAQAGAAHVDAIDKNPAIHLGPRITAANACGDRIRFHAGDARDVTLDTAADVLIGDLRGPTPFSGPSLEILVDARRRLLRPGGTVIAMRDTLYAAPANAPLAFRREIEAPLRRNGVSLEPVARVVYDTPLRCSVAPADLLAPGSSWLTLDYRTLAGTNHDGHTEWTFDHRSRISGLALWFSSDLCDGVRLSSAPGERTFAYSQIFLPFRNVVAVEPGDALRIHIELRLARDDYVWMWQAWRCRAGQHDASLVVEQNSLAEIVIDPSALAARAEAQVSASSMISS